ncbi:MAG: hypothetical protein WAM30_07500, partial [Candidatus Dormiibacterota bacterium]
MTDVRQRPHEIAEAARAEIEGAPDRAALEHLRIAYLGQRSELMAIPRTIKSLPGEQRSETGKAFNAARQAIEQALEERSRALEDARLEHLEELESIDVTFPGTPTGAGRPHVLTQVQREV